MPQHTSHFKNSIMPVCYNESVTSLIQKEQSVADKTQTIIDQIEHIRQLVNQAQLTPRPDIFSDIRRELNVLIRQIVKLKEYINDEK